MADVVSAKRDFLLSLKQLRYFFNNLKSVHGQYDTTIHRLEDPETLNEARNAEVHTEKALLASPSALKKKQEQLERAIKFQKQQEQKLNALLTDLLTLEVTPDELNPKLSPDVKYFEQAIEAMTQATKFSNLIDTQENDCLKKQIEKKQQVVDLCDAENTSLQAQLDLLLQQVS